MSGHSKWNNIKRKKEKADGAKAKIFTKIGRELAVAVKEGGSADPAANSRLRDAIAKAKAANVPNDNIDRIIKKAAGEGSADNYENMTYEGYGPSGVAVIVEALTDNRNRTAADVRHAFDKFGGNLGTTGCVSFMFNKKGVIVIEREGLDEDTVMADALEAGAADFEADEDVFYHLHRARRLLRRPGGPGEEGLRVCLRRGGNGPRHLHHHHRRGHHHQNAEDAGPAGGQRRRAERVAQLGRPRRGRRGIRNWSGSCRSFLFSCKFSPVGYNKRKKNRNGKGNVMRHLIDPLDLSRPETDRLLSLAEKIIASPGDYAHLCDGKILATLFYEPSTRTRLSFEAAMMRPGRQAFWAFPRQTAPPPPRGRAWPTPSA